MLKRRLGMLVTSEIVRAARARVPVRIRADFAPALTGPSLAASYSVRLLCRMRCDGL